MTTKRHSTFHTSYEDRAVLPKTSPLQTYLLHLIALKKTNLCVSADVSTTAELLAVAEEVGDSICILKTHADIIDDWGDRTVRGLREVAKRKRFLIFEDRKFGDIGSMLFLLTALAMGRMTTV
jgi:uridine monophosphate synthetase